MSGCTFLFDPKQGGGEGETGGFEADSNAEETTGAVDTETGFDDPTTDSGEDDSGGCGTLVIDPRRSLIETNPEALVGLGMAPILHQAAVASGLLADSKFTYTRLIDSFNSKELGLLAGGSHCDDKLVNGVPSLGGYPIQCPRAEAGQVGSLHAWFPIAAINRFDLATADGSDGSDCGEQRLIVASQAQQRMLVIFEARIPNPDPTCGLAACRPIVDFWLSLSEIDDPASRAEQLRMAFLDGHPTLSQAGFAPFMSAINMTFGSGQIRSNSFDEDPWTLRQFRFVRESPRLSVVPVPVTASVFGPLWNDLGGHPQGPACRQSILANLDGLLVDDLATMGMIVDPICFAGESRDDEHGDYAAALLAGSGEFAAALGQRLVELGSDLTPVDIAHRARFAVDCMGCHEAATGLALGHGLTAPSTLGFVHVDEAAMEHCGDGLCFAISPALAQVFLPARLTVLEDFLAQVGCEGSCEH